jgi:hypothetical protein
VGIRVSRAVGKKFEFEAGPVKHAGGAQPRVSTPPEQPAPQPAEQPPIAPPAASAVAHVWK